MANRGTYKKMKDKWRSKEWYRILAPEMFNKVQLGETVCSEPDTLINRAIQSPMSEITGSLSKNYIKLNFKICSVDGLEAQSAFVGHELRNDHIRKLTRRKHTKIDLSFPVKTSDGMTIIMKPVVITLNRIQTTKERAIRKLVKDIVVEEAGKFIAENFVRFYISGELNSIVNNKCKSIYPIHRVEMGKSTVIGHIIGIPTKKEESSQEETIDEAKQEDTSEETKVEPVKKEKKEKKELDKEVIDFLTSVKGVGPAKAKLIINSGIDTMIKVMDSSEDDIIAAGIDKKLAIAIIEKTNESKDE